MKFDYEVKPKEDGCVAYIDRDGDLIMKNTNNRAVWLTVDGDVYPDLTFDPRDATHKFYKGDKVTITF